MADKKLTLTIALDTESEDAEIASKLEAAFGGLGDAITQGAGLGDCFGVHVDNIEPLDIETAERHGWTE